MKTILLFTLILSSFHVNAQKERTKSSGKIEYSMFGFPKYTNSDLPKRSITVSDIQIVQTLSDSVRLGFAMKNMSNRTVVLMPEKPLTYFLQQQVYKMYSDDFKEKGAQLLWVIKDLRVGERPGSDQYAYLHMNADAYILTDLKLYKPVCSLDTILVYESGGSGATVWHGEHIENALKILLKQTLLHAKDVLEQTNPGISLEKIKDNATLRIDFSILTDDTYREGAYASFEEFLQNKPSISDFRVFSIGPKKEIKFVKLSEDNSADTVNIWGLCKGGEIYKFDRGLLISIEKQGTNFIISNYIELTKRRNTAAAVTPFVGFLGGGIIVGISRTYYDDDQGPAPVLIKSIPYIKKEKQFPEATCIDMRTGELSF